MDDSYTWVIIVTVLIFAVSFIWMSQYITAGKSDRFFVWEIAMCYGALTCMAGDALVRGKTSFALWMLALLIATTLISWWYVKYHRVA